MHSTVSDHTYGYKGGESYSNFLCIINNSLTKDFTKKTSSDVNDCSFVPVLFFKRLIFLASLPATR